MALSRTLALDAGQIDFTMLTQCNLRIATLGQGTRIKFTPMGFGWTPFGECLGYGEGGRSEGGPGEQLDAPPFATSARCEHARWVGVEPDDQSTRGNFRLARLCSA